MILPYPEVHEMERDGDIFRCPYCEQMYELKNDRLQTKQSGTSNARHFYYSKDVKIGVRLKELGDE